MNVTLGNFLIVWILMEVTGRSCLQTLKPVVNWRNGGRRQNRRGGYFAVCGGPDEQIIDLFGIRNN